MSEINFKQKISIKRPYSKQSEVTDEYTIVRIFESDRGRIVNSAAIRRLQQKTQVFPLERNSAVRSRLTHSLEVQQAGRYIAKEIIDRFKRKNKVSEFGLEKLLDPFESIIEMACLMHDIGNPPFGHFGESAINNWFRDLLAPPMESELNKEDKCKVEILQLKENEAKLNVLRGKIRHDLSNFEGNAQAIRLVHTLLKLNLTYAQVGCILKYTKPAYWPKERPLPDSHKYLMKKPGFYLAEEEFVSKLRGELNMGEFNRFPLTYIMEAADDISYCIADLEDAVEKKIFTVAQLYQYLEEEWGSAIKDDLFDQVIGKALRQAERWARGRSTEDQFFMYLRVNTVNELVPYAAQRFIENLPEIFVGTFNQALLEDDSPPCQLLGIFKKVAKKHVFNHPEVEQLELQGDRVISGLLDIYSRLLDMPHSEFARLVKDDHHQHYPIETRLFHKLSTKHRLAYSEAIEGLQNSHNEQAEILEYYYRARLIQDYISGMTDLYAYDEYRRLMAAE